MPRRTVSILCLRFMVLLAIGVILGGCGGSEPTPEDLVMEYYAAIEAGDADLAASVFADDAVIVIPSGNVLTGRCTHL